MKRKNLLIGSIGLAAVAGALVLSPWNWGGQDGAYSSTPLSVLQEQAASDAQKWLEARYIDVTTGQKVTQERLLELYAQEQARPKNGTVVFEELGPDNIGGRTRAILPDRTNINRVWAGGVSGGLFISENKATTWTRLASFPGLPYISSIAQTADGTVFVATGSNNEQWNGNGVYMTQDAGQTWTIVPGTATLPTITEIVTPDAGNTVWMATNAGVRTFTVGASSLTPVTIAAGGCGALQISKDGQVLIAAMSSNRAFVSTDGGSTWTDQSGTAANNKVPTNAGRIEFAISPTKNSSNNYSLYAVRTSSNLLGMHVSHDNGQTWNQFVGASGVGSNLDIYRDQGTYNSIVSVLPNDPEKILIGGIDIWQWKQTVNNPPSGGFDKLSQWFVAPTSNVYVHADNHELKWDNNNRLYIGNDGGIGISNDLGANFYPANRGFNITQFYGIGMDRDGRVIGGTQDNGTLYNDFSLSTMKEFSQVGGGDGFEAEISFFNPSVMFSSIYYGAISRSGDRGQSFAPFYPNFPAGYSQVGVSGANFPFHTEYVLAETFDNNSKDSVSFVPGRNYAAGSLVKVPSMASGDTINYITPTALYYDDTVFFDPSLTVTDYKITNNATNAIIDLGQVDSWSIFYDANPPATAPEVGDTVLVNGTIKIPVGSVTTYLHYYAKNPITNQIFDLGEETEGYNVSWNPIRVADPFQSWFVMFVNANGGELWATRDALRFSVLETKWIKIATGIGGNSFSSIDIEFSRDLNHCFVSSGTRVWRIDGLGDIYSQDPNFDALVDAAAGSKVQVFGSSCEGIALNPNDPDDLIILQGFGGTISRSANATAANPSFTPLTNLGVGAYDAIIDREDDDIIVVGTAFGVKVSINGGGTWTDASLGFENVPVYEVRQNWRTYNEGNRRPGEIYLGTFGRGIWASASLLGINEDNSSENVKKSPKLKLYPNPTTDVSTIAFDLAKNSTVTVKIFNIAGQLVKTVEEKNVSAGSQTMNLNVSNLPNGTYIVKFSAGMQQETSKFIKL